MRQNPHIVKKEELAHQDKTRTALYLAAENGNPDIVNLLLDNGANPGFMDDKLLTPLSIAVVNNRVRVVQSLLARRKPTPPELDPKCLALSHAFQANQPYIAFLLYQKGFRLYSDDNASVEFTLYSILETLFGSPISKDLVNHPNRFYANHNQRTNQITHHVQRSTLYSPLDTAVIRGDMKSIQKYATNHYLINKPGYLGLTPLHWATLKGDANIVDLLLRNNADPDQKTIHGLTPLHFSTVHDDGVIYQKIARVSIDINPCTTHSALTPLHMAVMEQNGLVLAAMANDHRIDYRAKTADGLTPTALADKKGLILPFPPTSQPSANDSKVNELEDLLADLQLSYEQYTLKSVLVDPCSMGSQTYLISQATTGVQMSTQTVGQPFTADDRKKAKL